MPANQEHKLSSERNWLSNLLFLPLMSPTSFNGHTKKQYREYTLLNADVNVRILHLY